MKPRPSPSIRGPLAFAALTFATLVPAAGQLAGQLGVLDLTANGGINPATSASWAEGDPYRLIFVTSATTTATSTDITTYNDFVQGVANASTAFPKLGNGLWKVVGSTESVDARDNTGTNPATVGIPVFLMDGTSLFAVDHADLWDGANIAVQFDETGAVPGGDGRVFTGSEADGTEEEGANQFLGSTVIQENGSVVVRTGGGQATGGQWMRVFSDNPEGARSVYAISEPLIVVNESDTTPPNLVSISDDKPGGSVNVPEQILYTVTFNEAMSAGTVDVSDFENDPALDTLVTINSVIPTADPASFEVMVSTTEAGSLKLQIKPGAGLTDILGNALVTSIALSDEDTISIIQDAVNPTLTSIVDNVSGGPIVATQAETPVYTVTFSEAIDPNTVGTDDFENGASAPTMIERVNPTSDPAVFEVVVTTSGSGELVLRIKAATVITDIAGNEVDTSIALADDTTINVNPVPRLTGPLGVFDSINANGGINPATNSAWADGDTYRLVFITSGTTFATSTLIEDYNSFVQAEAAAAGLGEATWKVIGSTATVDALDNTGTNPVSEGVPVFLMDGTTLFAADNLDLWDGANVAVQFDQTGTVFSSGDNRIFTGTEGSGIADTEGQVLGATGPVRTGGAAGTGNQWLRVFSDNPEAARSVYALSEPLVLTDGSTTNFVITDFAYSVDTSTLSLTWTSNPGQLYVVKYSPDMTSWDPELDRGNNGDNSIEGSAGDTTTATFDLSLSDIEGLPKLFLRVELQEPN